MHQDWHRISENEITFFSPIYIEHYLSKTSKSYVNHVWMNEYKISFHIILGVI